MADDSGANRFVRLLQPLLALGLALAALCGQDQPQYTFGTTVVDLSGLEGRVFFLDPGTQKLPDFSRRDPVGSVYTTMLNVWPQSFSEGFRA